MATIYRSTDTGAPILTGNPGAMVALLDACLVNGYGSTMATGTITSSGVNVSNNDTVTIDGTTYTFKTTLTPTAGEILIGASAAASLTNLASAMHAWGAAGTNYATGTATQTRLQVTALTATVMTLTAFVGGTGGNSIALAKSAATLTVSGATLSGGAGTNTTASLGWGSPFTGTQKAVYRAASGARHYLDIDDSAPDATAKGANFRMRGYEVMTAVGTGTGSFPTVTQAAVAVGLKSTTASQVNRPWILIGDGKTFYCFVDASGTTPPDLATHTWTTSFGFGEILSALTGDLYRSFINVHAVTSTDTALSRLSWGTSSVATDTTVRTQWMPRAYTGVGAATWVGFIGNPFNNAAAFDLLSGTFTFPNLTDGGIYANGIDVYERGTGATPIGHASSNGCRGRVRGVYQTSYRNNEFNDQDTFTGVGDFSGKTFIIIKWGLGVFAIDTGTWAASS